VNALWIALIIATVGCFGLKLAGVCLPEPVLNHPRVQRVAGLLPVAMLAALVAVQLLDRQGRYGVDWRMAAGVAAGMIALLVKQGFLVVFLVAIAVTAALRAMT
jgi:branched-subunit amino acid transport protein